MLDADRAERYDSEAFIMGLLNEKVAVVTGGAGGIGGASALAMAAEGATVVVADLDEVGAGAIADTIVSSGGSAFAVALDATKEHSAASMIESAVAAYGRIDVLHHNVARTNLGHDDSDAVSISSTAWDATIAVNLTGTLWCCRHAIQAMLRSGGGSIINTSSTASLAGAESRVAYSVSKAAINALTLHVATAFGGRGIRCNAILPGPVATQQMIDVLTDEYRIALEDNIPGPGIPGPEEVAHMACFLASDQARYVNGELIRLDAGMMCHQPTYSDLRRFGTHW
jgi:NAD(P)-dependent dehydrogenase (short-subunit alcohol dehydrogenase family)